MGCTSQTGRKVTRWFKVVSLYQEQLKQPIILEFCNSRITMVQMRTQTRRKVVMKLYHSIKSSQSGRGVNRSLTPSLLAPSPIILVILLLPHCHYTGTTTGLNTPEAATASEQKYIDGWKIGAFQTFQHAVGFQIERDIRQAGKLPASYPNLCSPHR